MIVRTVLVGFVECFLRHTIEPLQGSTTSDCLKLNLRKMFKVKKVSVSHES